MPISSGVISQDMVTFSGQNQFPMGSLEITFHGKVAASAITGTADIASLSLTKQKCWESSVHRALLRLVSVAALRRNRIIQFQD